MAIRVRQNQAAISKIAQLLSIAMQRSSNRCRGFQNRSISSIASGTENRTVIPGTTVNAPESRKKTRVSSGFFSPEPKNLSTYGVSRRGQSGGRGTV